eukprot:15459798-Alexandrium_andersonii.AAC.1
MDRRAQSAGIDAHPTLRPRSRRRLTPRRLEYPSAPRGTRGGKGGLAEALGRSASAAGGANSAWGSSSRDQRHVTFRA